METLCERYGDKKGEVITSLCQQKLFRVPYQLARIANGLSHHWL